MSKALLNRAHGVGRGDGGVGDVAGICEVNAALCIVSATLVGWRWGRKWRPRPAGFGVKSVLWQVLGRPATPKMNRNTCDCKFRN